MGRSAVRGALVAADGTAGVVVDGRPGGSGRPAVTFDGTGWRAAWADQSYVATSGAWTARLGAGAALLDPAPVLVSPPPVLGGIPGVIAFPALASDGTGALVGWLEIGADKSIQGALVYPPAAR